MRRAVMVASGVLGGEFLAGWRYRRAVTVDNTGNASDLTNYQVQLVLTAANFDLSRIQPNGEDFRVTDTGGKALPFWIETCRPHAVAPTATLWIRVPLVPASSSLTLYLYYGNARASALQNGSTTFEFFDDFTGGRTTTHVWTRRGVVMAGNAAEGNQVSEPCVIYEGNPQILTSYTNVFKMWYRAGWSTTDIRYAESPDGLTWTKYASNPVIASGYCPFVFKNGATYYLYLSTFAVFKRYSSSDGVTWALDSANVLAKGAAGQWDSNALGNSCVWIEGATWYMIYEAKNGSNAAWKLGLATSADGLSWSKSGSNPVLNETFGYGGPCVWKNPADNTYWLWCHGAGTNPDLLNVPTDLFRYSSANLTTWTPTPAGRTFFRELNDEGVGYAGRNYGQIADPYLLEVNGTVYLWYSSNIDGGGALYPGSHFRLATFAGGLADLVATDEDRLTTANASLGAAWTVRDSVVVNNDELVTPSGTADATPTYESSYAAVAYILQFWARREVTAGVRISPAFAYLDDNNQSRFFINNNTSTTFQSRVATTWDGGTELGANGTQNVDYHAWKIVKTGTTAALYIDGAQIGTTQNLNAVFNAATKIALAARSTLAHIETVLVRQYTTPEPTLTVSAEVLR